MTTLLWQALAATTLLAAAASASADATLNAEVVGADLAQRTVLGTVTVPNVGDVELTAQRDKRRVIVLASANGKVIGRGESAAGLDQTVLHVSAEGKLEKITVVWKKGDR